ncbi:hypothetical protein HG536_0F03310 [Torulaspora globosa]|uniref:Exocyst complex component Sec3 PIP2-binding N-terminal domain-containing protein n=1 Tax=Torulaspora globosa TaxID=48254 RepID=A0A7G3ZKH0_9SACH|nr:uncharacterized protein HG536_0F03310 [Torulaspora globosa]QLL34006.1 hypothetical protein HG536_0F03310 [Torulaspora globosa]
MKSSRSPFKKFSHSREGSTDEKPSSVHKRIISGSGSAKHARNVSGNSMGNAPPVSGIHVSHRRTTSNSSRSSQSSNFLAEQYERDRKAIISSCFTMYDRNSGAPNNYITHVRIIEDAKSPSSRPPPNAQLQNKKKRILILSSKPDSPNAIQLHKGRENTDGSFQIGRTWDLKELKRVERDTEVDEGFALTMGKKYYWETNSAKERTVFIKSLINTYMQAFDGHVPQLINWDLSIFYLDERSYQRAVITRVSGTDAASVNKTSGHSMPQAGPASPLGNINSMRDADASQQPTANLLHRAPYSNSPTIAEASKRYSSSQHENEGKPVAEGDGLNHMVTTDEPSFIDKNLDAMSKASVERQALSSARSSPSKDGYSSQSQGGASGNRRDHLLEDLNNVLASEIQYVSEAASNLEPGPLRPKEESFVHEDFSKESPPLVAKVESIVEDIRYEPMAFGDQDLDLNETISNEGDTTNDLSFERGDEVRHSQVLEPGSSHTYHEVSTIQEEVQFGTDRIAKDKMFPALEADRASDSKGPQMKKKAWDIEDEEILEILTDVNWGAEDDADNLIERLNSKIAEAEYNFNNSLLSLEKLALDLRPYEQNVARECDKLNPILSLFLMEMSNVSGDIEYVESQHNGLQVESANKKQLWNTLSELLNTVSLDEDSLGELLNCPIAERYLAKMEGQLRALFKALKAINGEEDEEHYNLGQMRALKHRRETYEKVTKVFLERLVNEMVGKFVNISIDELSEDHLTSFLSRLLRFSSLILFCKDVSPDSYKYLIEKWNGTICEVYNKMCQSVLRELELLKATLPSREKRTINEEPGLADLLSEWKHIKSKEIPRTKVSTSSELVGSLRKAMETFERWVIVYQNFIDNFFHICSKLDFEEFLTRFAAAESRTAQLLEIRGMQPDRTSAAVETQLVSKIFQPITARISSGLIEVLKCDRSIAPALMISLEREIKSLESSNAEFLVSALSRLLSQVIQVWSDYVDDQVMYMQRIRINVSSRSLLPSVIELPLFIKNSQDFIRETELELQMDDEDAFETRKIFEAACSKMSNCLADLFTTKNNDTKDLLDAAEAAETVPSESGNIDRTITLLMNCHWLLEILALLNSRGIFDNSLREAKSVFDVEKDNYASYLLRDSMPKLTSFIHGASNLIASTPTDRMVDPSKWAAYSKHNLEIILSSYTSHEIDTLVKRLHGYMLAHFANEPDESIKKALFDKIWSCIQGQTVSLYLRLYTLIEKHYKGTYVKFTKNDIITAFESYKKQHV